MCTQLLGYDTLKNTKTKTNQTKIKQKQPKQNNSQKPSPNSTLYTISTPPHPTPLSQIPNPTFNSHPPLFFYYLPLLSPLSISLKAFPQPHYIFYSLLHIQRTPQTHLPKHTSFSFHNSISKKIVSLETKVLSFDPNLVLKRFLA